MEVEHFECHRMPMIKDNGKNRLQSTRLAVVFCTCEVAFHYKKKEKEALNEIQLGNFSSKTADTRIFEISTAAACLCSLLCFIATQPFTIQQLKSLKASSMSTAPKLQRTLSVLGYLLSISKLCSIPRCPRKFHYQCASAATDSVHHTSDSKHHVDDDENDINGKNVESMRKAGTSKCFSAIYAHTNFFRGRFDSSTTEN